MNQLLLGPPLPPELMPSAWTPDERDQTRRKALDAVQQLWELHKGKRVSEIPIILPCAGIDTAAKSLYGVGRKAEGIRMLFGGFARIIEGIDFPHEAMERISRPSAVDDLPNADAMISTFALRWLQQDYPEYAARLDPVRVAC